MRVCVGFRMSILIKTSRRPIISFFRENKPTIRPQLDNDNRKSIKTIMIASMEPFKYYIRKRVGGLSKCLLLPTRWMDEL